MVDWLVPDVSRRMGRPVAVYLGLLWHRGAVTRFTGADYIPHSFLPGLCSRIAAKNVSPCVSGLWMIGTMVRAALGRLGLPRRGSNACDDRSARLSEPSISVFSNIRQSLDCFCALIATTNTFINTSRLLFERQRNAGEER